MPENPNQLHVVGITSDGRMWHTRRSPTGWTPFAAVPGDGYAVDVAATRLINPEGPSGPLMEGVVVAALSAAAPRPAFSFRSSDTGQWSQLGAGNVPPILGATRIALSCSTTGPFDGPPIPWTVRLHVAWTAANGHLLTMVSGLGASTGQGFPADVELTGGLNRGDLTAVALAPVHGRGSPDTFAQLATVSADGNIYSSLIRSGAAGGSGGSALLDVEQLGAGEGGTFIETAIALQADGTLHYGGVTGDRRVLLATRRPDGKWRSWSDLEEGEIVIIGGPWVVVTRGIVDSGTFERLAFGVTDEGLHMLGVTSTGALQHQLQPSASQQFRDVEVIGVGQDVGNFTAVAVA